MFKRTSRLFSTSTTSKPQRPFLVDVLACKKQIIKFESAKSTKYLSNIQQSILTVGMGCACAIAHQSATPMFCFAVVDSILAYIGDKELDKNIDDYIAAKTALEEFEKQ